MKPDVDRRPAELLRIVEAFARESRLLVPAGGIGLDTRLEADLGLDSLGRSELLSRVEKGLETSLPEEALLAATPRDLLALVGPALHRSPSRPRRHRRTPPSPALPKMRAPCSTPATGTWTPPGPGPHPLPGDRRAVRAHQPTRA